MLLEEVLFYIFSILLIAASVMVITAKNPVHSAVFLVFAFVTTAALWIVLEAEFLALVLILVYVGAVMTLFLFVVMMLNVKKLPEREGVVRYMPFAVIILGIILGITFIAIGPSHFGIGAHAVPAHHGPNYSNTKELGSVLYTQYALGFELAACILLVAIVAAITLSFRGRQKDSLGQKPHEQVAVRREDRVRIVKMQSEQNYWTSPGEQS